MSEQTAGQARRPGSTPASRGGAAGFLTRKLGPFPTWVWIVVVGGLLLWRTTSKTPATAAATSTDTGSTTAGQVPQVVGQTYVTAPAAPGSAATSTDTGSTPAILPPGSQGTPVTGRAAPPTASNAAAEAHAAHVAHVAHLAHLAHLAATG